MIALGSIVRIGVRAVVGVGVALAAAGMGYAGVIYVDDDAPLGGDGAYWPTAFKYLQDALVGAGAGDEIRVAQGVYKPDQDEGGNVTPGDREETFQVASGVVLYGGYGGLSVPAPAMNKRDVELYETILSGDLAGNDEAGFVNREENSYHVVTATSASDTTIVDGFTIRGGNASEPDVSAHRNGGGMYVQGGGPQIAYCKITDNAAWSIGGGIYAYYASPTLETCALVENIATGSSGAHGGGLGNVGGDPVLIACTFSGNEGCPMGGGISTIASSNPSLTNCTFRYNQGEDGGAVNVGSSSTPTLTNCTLRENSASSGGGGMFSTDSAPVVVNCVLWGNTDQDGTLDDESAQIHLLNSTAVVVYSCIQNCVGFCSDPNDHNIGDDPVFADADGRLAAGSPCIDAGDNDAVPSGVLTDYDGRPRFIEDPDTSDTGNGTPPIVDMGAYEACGGQERGDCNGDSSINGLDIDPFVEALVNPAQYNSTHAPLKWQCTADINCDGSMNGLDIDPFVQCLTGGCPPCP